MNLEGTLSAVKKAEQIENEEKRMIEAVRQKSIRPHELENEEVNASNEVQADSSSNGSSQLDVKSEEEEEEKPSKTIGLLKVKIKLI
jgi:hypothetical protein